MVLSLGFIMGFIGVAIALLIGILIFSEVNDVINENNIPQEKTEELSNALWTILAVLPITLFFILFRMFSGMEVELGFKRKSKWILLEFLWLIGLAKKVKENGR